MGIFWTIRKWIFALLSRNFWLGIGIGFFIASALTVAIPSHALTTSEKNIIESDQESAMKYTGSYQPVYNELVQVFTYETICKGFYTVEDNGVTITYTGFGELADQYTYTVDKLIKSDISTTTPIKDEKIITDIITVTP